MDYKNLSKDTWTQLDDSGSMVSGYKSIWLTTGEGKNSNIHIFKDESGDFHLAILVRDNKRYEIENPGVNGLHIATRQYRMGNDAVNTFIDIRCNLKSYLEEFTEVTKDIAKYILDSGIPPFEAVNHVIRNWRQFWASENKTILSEEQQIGLMCELIVLEQLCKINPGNALNWWVGPLGEGHDFNFTDWSIEVKGTLKHGHIHTINGIDQLKPYENKQLAFISFLASCSDTGNSMSLHDIVERITNVTLITRPDLIIKFNELLARIGYNPIFAKEYLNFKVEILESILYHVDDQFPTLTSANLVATLNNRITMVRYDVRLEGVPGNHLSSVNWGDYFY